MNDMPIPSNNIPCEIREVINEVKMMGGIKELEDGADGQEAPPPT
jgi:hypothetical protein